MASRTCFASYSPLLRRPYHPRTVFCAASLQSPALAQHRRRGLQTQPDPKIPEFGFAFDVDGVLVRQKDPIPRAREALLHLQQQRIPFILLTNGGGKTEAERVEELSGILGVSLDTSTFIQSHTPFADFHELKRSTVLVVGGDADKCRLVAESYGFERVVTPGDILVRHPEVWPFSHPFLDYHKAFARPLTWTIDQKNPSRSLKIDAIFVFNDPRDWGLDATVILDLLLSREGILGTVSPKNGDPALANRGYLQDGQPTLYFSNPDLWWAAKFHLPRLGQGAFRASLEGMWAAVTGGERAGVKLQAKLMGKPMSSIYHFAEKRLIRHRNDMFPDASTLKRVFMVGDNPESDIRGGNSFYSPRGVQWSTVLVETGVYTGGKPGCEPTAITRDVYEAVQWALKQQAWQPSFLG